ncbi:hypothetical protein [Mucilaginibacter phyllosphaerae]|uniref:Uncharacterized protein n=1 Tax=Mucilaginibacter phyllosphaerae TaxID=1812349 RepID=A0A4Y8ABM0_9SPHI|nr:hypothetical protein [Mucilaginibacter phyllosphaerae]MBB3969315.1 hypothetical protein [Mucilaginibacter phyllosphaerae]TEW65890.1 hypothetical protein E2R65_12205 [Mucilaginibacter phyllosphaerae]GGH07646.1 hypothetical protein GCM10007352_12490 [Mucilaginibacter phyllosphaerae]
MEVTELKKLRDKCILFNQFMLERGAIPKELVGAYTESNRLLESAYQEGKIKPLRAASNDIDDQVIRHMPSSMALELKSFFKAKLGIDLDIFEKARLKSIEKVLKKGKINNPQEYELLLNRVDEVHLAVSKAEEIERLNNLLITYDKGK